MKIRNTVVMFLDIIPDSHSMLMPAVKGTVHKFHLWHFMIQEKLQELGFLAKLQDYEPVDFWGDNEDEAKA